MRNKPRLRSKLLLGALVAVLLAHGAIPLNNPKVRQIGELLRCQCGCPYTVAECDMQNCHFAEPARDRILGMVEQGKSEKEILDAFVADYGLKILTRPPAEGFFLVGWIMPGVGVLVGLGIVALVLQRFLKQRPSPATPAPAADSPELARYRDQIEKELSDLD